MDANILKTEIQEGLKLWPNENFNWIKLPGDASNRSYWRIQSPKLSLILMVNATEAFKSEEAGATGQAAAQELDFVNVGRSWKSQGVHVPEIYWVEKKSKYLLLEDFGDELLYSRRQRDSAHEFYKKALDQLSIIQNSKPTDRIQSRSFSKELLAWEFEHFMEYALEKRERPLTKDQVQALRNWMKKVVDRLSGLSPVVSHRDFHSKNLIITSKNEIGVIDFQDALMGPDTYDLASLLRDSYVRLEDKEEEDLLQYFEKSAQKKINRTDFGWMSLQRNMKAVGRFFYIQMVKGKDTHIPFVKPSMHRIFRSLEQVNEPEIHKILEVAMKGDY